MTCLLEEVVGRVQRVSRGAGGATAQDSTLPAANSGMWRSHDVEETRLSSGKASPPQPVGEKERGGSV